MNLANKLTVSRIVLTFAFMFFLFSKGLAAKSMALATFVVASATDVLDGFIAKTRNQITDFGKLMDPIADKVLVLSAFLAFVEMDIIPAWMVLIIIFREAVVTGLRLMALNKGKVISADKIGKHKTVWQVISIFVILLFLVTKELGQTVFHFWNEKTENTASEAIFILMCITIVLTLASGIAYLVKNKEVYSNAKTS